MIYHIVAGDMAAEPLQEAITQEESMSGQIYVMRDLLHVGPIKKGEGQPFSQMRTEFWHEVIPNEKHTLEVDDLERLMEVSTALSNNEEAQVWIWMAPWATDVCLYHWVLTFLSKHIGRLYLVNIAGLPFLDEQGKVYYPKNLSDILPKELVKARRLAREITPAELEVDGEEWKNLKEENAGIRVHEGGKKLVSKEADYYDKQLESFCSQQYQKASRVVSQALSKLNIPTGDAYLGWRLRLLAEEGRLLIQGDSSKTLKDYSIKLPGGDAEATTDDASAAAPTEESNN